MNTLPYKITIFTKVIEADFTSTHNLCFRAKIRKYARPYKPQVYYIKVGYDGSIKHTDMLSMGNDNVHDSVIFESRCEKTGLRSFRPGPTQTGMYSHRRWLEA